MTGAPCVEETAPDLWRWVAVTPDRQPGTFGREVASVAMPVRGGQPPIVDPLLPTEQDEATDLLDDLAAKAGAIHVFITIPYHVRNTAAVVARYGARRVRVWGESSGAVAPAQGAPPSRPSVWSRGCAGARHTRGRCVSARRPFRCSSEASA